MVGYTQFIRGQLSTPPAQTTDFSGRTILVTGANNGLGLEAAKLLVHLSCSTIILGCRDHAKGDATKKILESLPTRSGTAPTIIPFELEMTSFSSVLAFANRCKDLPRLDTAILNAGISVVEYKDAEGYESTLTVNIISTFLLATLLLPTLRSSAKRHQIKPTISIVGSAVHFWTDPKRLTNPKDGEIFTSLSDPKTADMKGRYFLSKLPVMLLVKHLASVLTRSSQSDGDAKPLVVLNNVAPGLCVTNLLNNHTSSELFFLRMLGRSPEHGARTLVHGAAAGIDSHGQYLSECQIKPTSPFVQSREGDHTAKRLWDELVVIYERISPGCTSEW